LRAKLQTAFDATSEPYRTGTIKRERRTKAEIAQLEKQILDVLEACKQSVRHVFYRMTDTTLPVFVEKTEAGYRQVQHLTMKMRRDERLPYGSLTDTSRRGYFVNTYHGAADFIRSMNGLYRADLWQSAEYYCEVWCESRSIAGVIQDTCEELAVSLFPAGGFSSVTFVYEASTEINDSVDKPVVIFYIGDYDPSGVLVDEAIEREMRLHLRKDIELTFKRLAINKEQIEDYDLPTKPRKKGDKRAKHIKRTVEAEALPAEVLIALLRVHIESLLPQGALEVAKVAEESEREYLNLLARRAEHRRDTDAPRI
jgi:hypothetical protein